MINKISRNWILLSFFLGTTFCLNVSSMENFDEICNSNEYHQHVEAEKVKLIRIEFLKYKKWSKNLLRSITDKKHRDISDKFKKRFKANLFVDFENGLICEFKAKIRISGDHRDHLDFVPSLDVELINGHINNVTNFKLFIPKTRFGNNEIITTSIMKELGFLSPDTYFVKADVNNQKVQYIFQEKIVKEFIESNNLREGPIFEGDERFIFNAGLPFGLARQSNEKWIVGGKSSLEISKNAIGKINKVYLESLLGEQYFKNRNGSFFKVENLSNFENFIIEAQSFSAILFALEATHALRPHNRKFYYDPLYKSYRPIYYDGMSKILDTYRRSAQSLLDNEKLNYDEFIGSRYAFLSLNKINRDSLRERIKDAGLLISLPELNKIIDSVLSRLNLMSKQNSERQINDHKLYFSINSDFENKGLRKGLKLAFSSKSLDSIEVCNFELTTCTEKKLSLEDYAKVISGKYVDPDDKQYIFIGNKYDYLYNDLEKVEFENEIFLDKTTISVIGNLDVEIDEENKYIKFKQQDANSKVLIFGGNIKDWDVMFMGSSENYELKEQRFDRNLLTGCLTFLDIEVSGIKIDLTDSYCEDGVNFIRSEGTVKKLSIMNSSSDAIDADFSYLLLENVNVQNAGNDCLDLSSGEYRIEKAVLKKCSDKGISIGEKSRLYIQKAIISEANMGVASKDSSIAEIKNMTATDVNTCFSAYRKKQEFWGGKILTYEHNCNDQDFHVEKGSSIKRVLDEF